MNYFSELENGHLLYLFPLALVYSETSGYLGENDILAGRPALFGLKRIGEGRAADRAVEEVQRGGRFKEAALKLLERPGVQRLLASRAAQRLYESPAFNRVVESRGVSRFLERVSPLRAA